MSQHPLDVPRIQDVFIRVCTIHHQKKARFHLQRAAFEEKQGNFDFSVNVQRLWLSIIQFT
jgi:hypothetical protein